MILIELVNDAIRREGRGTETFERVQRG